jgi:hypothetical protein
LGTFCGASGLLGDERRKRRDFGRKTFKLFSLAPPSRRRSVLVCAKDEHSRTPLLQQNWYYSLSLALSPLSPLSSLSSLTLSHTLTLSHSLTLSLSHSLTLTLTLTLALTLLSHPTIPPFYLLSSNPLLTGGKATAWHGNVEHYNQEEYHKYVYTVIKHKNKL